MCYPHLSIERNLFISRHVVLGPRKGYQGNSHGARFLAQIWITFEGVILSHMNILGVSFDYHDAAAVLLSDGRIIAAAQEERFTRKKHDVSLPARSIEFCLRQA